MEVTTYNQKGESVGKINLPKELFEVALNSDLVYQVAVTQMANRRQGNAHTKDRGEVSGGGKKPWRQKGTGRARHGSTRSPLWRHGGVVFGPRNIKVYGGKINKKMRRKALAMILSAKLADNSLIMLDKLEIDQPKTKEMAQTLANIKKAFPNYKEGTTMIALPQFEQNAVLSARNLPGVTTIEVAKLNVLDLLNVKNLLMPVQSICVIEKIVANSDKASKVESAAGAKIAKKPVKKAAAKTIKKAKKS